MNDIREKKYLSKEEVCDYLKLKKTTVNKLFRREDFPKVQIGGSASVEIHALDSYLEKNQGRKIFV